VIMCLCARRSGRSCACVLGGVGDHVCVCVCVRRSRRSCACVLGGVGDHVWHVFVC
jgi:hypothetical protein